MENKFICINSPVNGNVFGILLHNISELLFIYLFFNSSSINGRLKLNVAPLPSALFSAHILPP
jgi:hypothetical protein